MERRDAVEGERAGWGGLSDGQSKGADNAVHGLVLPSHSAAPCRGKEACRPENRKSRAFRVLRIRPNAQYSTLCSQQRRSARLSSIKRFKR